ncbi:hypothetical protein PMX13_09255 [Collinsella aerofaciens]|uniref:hypothetical protein n=1 Tax=Collinsella aerofaciens TaxID=74426 RepID=UPI00232D5F05|nr:hypothetical protein [Collinsella aerofaciens]MDB1860659.1 hypothetical protein [Collinsella aerofaciens]
MDGEIGVRTKAIIVALLVCLSAPQLGCSGVAKQGSGSTERAATAVKNKDKKKPSEEKAAQASGAKTEEKKESDGKDQKSDDSKKEDNKSSDSSKSDNKGDSSQSKQNSGSSQGSSGNNSSSNGGSQKKWVAEQGHWETDYSQVWVPNVVYTRHPRYWVNHGGTMVGPFDSEDAAYSWSENDAFSGGIGGSIVDDSYTTSEDQGHYEQKATGQHWVVDVAGHWE